MLVVDLILHAGIGG